LSEARFVLQW
jgi:hypothetical protein